MAAPGPGAPPKAEAGGVGGARRRLSVMSDNKLVEGVDSMTMEDKLAGGGGDGGAVVREYSGISKKGYAPYNPRKKNQDALSMVQLGDVFVFLVLDGHGEAGHEVSGFFQERFIPTLSAKPGFGEDMGEAGGTTTAIADTIRELEMEILANTRVDTEFSGTTFVVAVVKGNQLICANIGDSRLTLGSYNADSTALVARNISIDHKPDLPAEKKRITDTGGRVFAVEYDDGIDGPPRVWLGHMDVPGLAMSRSLGDAVAHSAGVSSEPEFFYETIAENACCLAIASDGLWEFMNDQDVINMVHNIVSPLPAEAVNRLVEEANARWMREEQVIDDTTVAIIYLNDYKRA